MSSSEQVRSIIYKSIGIGALSGALLGSAISLFTGFDLELILTAAGIGATFGLGIGTFICESMGIFTPNYKALEKYGTQLQNESAALKFQIELDKYRRGERSTYPSHPTYVY